MTAQDALDEAFGAVRREWFLRAAERAAVERDEPLSIGCGQTNSQPRTVRDMLYLLAPQPGQRVLDVGSGSGWTTALLAHLVAPGGDVLGVERVAELVDFGRGNLARAQRALGDRLAPARIERAGERLGAPDLAPFDRILVSAEPRELPADLVDQLAPGGVMVIPVRGEMLRVTRDADGRVRTTRHGDYRFVPLLPT